MKSNNTESDTNIVAVVQARMGSTRLPHKMMLSLHGQPIIEWVLRKVRMSKLLDNITVAIPDNRDNDVLKECLESLEADVYRGSENDVLNRIYNAAKTKAATHVVRVCADNPLVSGNEIDNLIKFYLENPCDYAYNGVPKGNAYPDGLGAEIVPFAVLEYLEKIVMEKSDREHCFSFIVKNREKFSVKTFDPPNPRLAHPELRLDIDDFEDYRRLCLKALSIDIGDDALVRVIRGDNSNQS